MKIFPNGIDINETGMLLLQEEVDDVEQWLRDVIKAQVQNGKVSLRRRWLRTLEEDPAIDAFPKTLDGMIDLIMSRPYFRTRKQDDSLLANTTFTEL